MPSKDSTEIDGMMFIALVLVPALHGLEDATLRSRLVQNAGIVLLLVVLLGLMLRG